MGNQGSSAHEPFDRAAQAAANADLKMVLHLIKLHLQFIIQLDSLNTKLYYSRLWPTFIVPAVRTYLIHVQYYT